MATQHIKKGIYQVRSDGKDYLKFLELVAEGKATQMGERYLPKGVVERAYQVGARKNPAIRIGAGFFVNAVRDYSEWRVKWWRECVQNAVDAGARHVGLDSARQDDGTVTVSCTDDGSGMTEDVLFNKFLVLGESGKERRAGMIGGFGKAKELLVLPWLNWRIRTGGIEVEGSGLDYEVRKIPPMVGTTLEVRMPADQHTTEASALEYLQRSSIRGVRFEVNGMSFTDSMRRGSFIKDLSFGKLYRNKTKKHGAVYVRANGLYMFQASSFDYKYGTIIVELEGDTTQLLTANRDSFRSWRHDDEIRSFVNEIVTEGELAMKSKLGLVTEVWKGESRITNDQGMTDVLDNLGAVPPIPEGKSVSAQGAVAEQLVVTLNELALVMASENDLGLGPASGDVAKQIIHEPVIGATNAEAFARQLVWKPDFMVRNEIEGFRVPAKFRPEKMSAALVALAKVWAEACRWVFIQLGRHGEYGVGFIFSDDTMAQYRTESDGSKWLLLNPVVDSGRPGKLLSKTRVEDIKSIYASAAHEVTHMAYGYSAHDSSFAALLTNVMAQTVDGWPVMKRIAKAVKQRKPIGEAKPKGAKKSKKTPVSLLLDGAGWIHLHPEEKEISRGIPTHEIFPQYTGELRKWIQRSLPSSELHMLEQSNLVLAMLDHEIVRQLMGLNSHHYLGNLDAEIEFSASAVEVYVTLKRGVVAEAFTRGESFFKVALTGTHTGEQILKAIGKTPKDLVDLGSQGFNVRLPMQLLASL